MKTRNLFQVKTMSNKMFSNHCALQLVRLKERHGHNRSSSWNSLGALLAILGFFSSAPCHYAYVNDALMYDAYIHDP